MSRDRFPTVLEVPLSFTVTTVVTDDAQKARKCKYLGLRNRDR